MNGICVLIHGNQGCCPVEDPHIIKGLQANSKGWISLPLTTHPIGPIYPPQKIGNPKCCVESSDARDLNRGKLPVEQRLQSFQVCVNNVSRLVNFRPSSRKPFPFSSPLFHLLSPFTYLKLTGPKVDNSNVVELVHQCTFSLAAPHPPR